MNNEQNTRSDKDTKLSSPALNSKMCGMQSIAVILLLILAAFGWGLYVYQLDKTTPTGGSSNGTTQKTEEKVTYTPIEKTYVGDTIKLPDINTTSPVSVEEALMGRRSARTFGDTPLSITEFGQILWAAQGVTDKESGGRTAPSAKSLYPINLYVVVRNVRGVESGFYHYLPAEHAIRPLIQRDYEIPEDAPLKGEAQQDSVKNAPTVLVYGAIYPKAQSEFPGEAGIKMTNQESGHVAQNVYLQAGAIGLGTVVVGGFNPTDVKKELELPADETVIYLQPFGPKGE